MTPLVEKTGLFIRAHPRDPWFTGLLLVVLLTTAIPSANCDERDWPQWRGPRRDGVAGTIRLPTNWLDADLKQRWRVPLGEGYASPLVTGDRVFTFGRELGSEVVQSHDLATGKVLWRFAYPAPYEVKEIAGVHGAGPRSTPVVHEGRLFTVGINEVVHCLDAVTGRMRWRVDFPHRYRTTPPGYGASSSPLIVGRLLLVPASDRVIAVDWHSGSVIWRALTDTFYSSLFTTELVGRSQIVGFARYRLVGLEPRDGRLLWSHRYPSMWGSNVATPVIWRDRVIITSPTQGTRALRLRERDGLLAVQTLWQTKSLRAYLTSPVVHNGFLYGLDESGQLLCLNAEDGRTAWAHGNFGDFGSLVLVGSQLLILDGSGELTAIEATPITYRQLGQRDVAESTTWTHLVVAQGCLFVRDKKGLACFELPREW